MAEKYPVAEGWWRPGRKVTRLACCDCGLVHEVRMRTGKDGILRWLWKRDQRSTGQLRRHREYERT